MSGTHPPLNVIVGLGKTGVAVARYLQARGERFAVTDSRVQPPGLDELKTINPQVHCLLGDISAELCSKAARIILSPGIALSHPALHQARAAGVEIIGDIELFVREARSPIVAITGSNGKSTVTALTAHLLNHAHKRALIGGNFGTPALDLLSEAKPDFYVLELSSFQLETTHSLSAAAAAVLNISEDHMDRYADITAYAEAKARIYHRAKVAVFNADDRETQRELERAKHRVAFSLLDENADYALVRINGKHWLSAHQEPFISQTALPLQGDHNAANVLAAVALCEAVGLPVEKLRDGLRSFQGLPHRCVLVREREGVRYFNDSKATNVGSALAAINGLSNVVAGKIVLIAGGDAKGQDLSPLTTVLRQHVSAMILIGKDANRLAAISPEPVTTLHADSLHQAVALASAHAQAGDVVLLSPACASLDMFKDYADRGDQFTRLVEALP